MILANATIVDDNFQLENCDIRIDGKRIVEVGTHLSGEEIWDMSGKFILPGFIDTHMHGACGMRGDDENSDLSKITEFEVTQGVTGIALTTSCIDFSKLLRCMDHIVDESKKVAGSKILGIHAEGPFLNKERQGGMLEEYIIEPDLEKLKQMIEQGKGLLKFMTIAPEMPNAIELIEYAVSSGLVVSLGHTDATYDETMAAIAAGASQTTHTFNAMRPYNHREPGVLGAALVDDRITCEMISDYVHLHPATVELIYRLKKADHIKVISDSVSPAGLKVTEFEEDGERKYVKNGVLYLSDGTIDGSVKTLLDGVQNLLHAGVPITNVVKMACYNPAKSLGLEKELGSIAKGKYADLVVLNQSYDVEYTFVNGNCVYKAEEQ